MVGTTEAAKNGRFGLVASFWAPQFVATTFAPKLVAPFILPTNSNLVATHEATSFGILGLLDQCYRKKNRWW